MLARSAPRSFTRVEVGVFPNACEFLVEADVQRSRRSPAHCVSLKLVSSSHVDLAIFYATGMPPTLKSSKLRIGKKGDYKRVLMASWGVQFATVTVRAFQTFHVAVTIVGFRSSSGR